MRLFTTKNEDALTDHSDSLFVLQYVELSSLVQDIPTRPMARKRLEHELCRRYGAGQATRWDCAEELIARGQAHDHDHDHANVTDLMADIAEKGRKIGGADDFLDYLGGSSCIHTKIGFEPCSCTSSWASAWA
jgi:hypothetical protein